MFLEENNASKITVRSNYVYSKNFQVIIIIHIVCKIPFVRNYCIEIQTLSNKKKDVLFCTNTFDYRYNVIDKML